jgi:hypothetical protein
MPRTRRLALVLALALAGVGAACGGGEDPAAKQAEYADAVAASLQGAFAAEGLDVDEASARCAGERAVEILGVSAFEDAGVTPDEIRSQADLDPIQAAGPTPEQAGELADGLFECVPVGEQIANFLRTAAEAEGVEIAEESWACIAENAQSSELLRDLFAEQVMVGGTPSLDTADPQVVQDVVGDCLTLEELLKLAQATGLG